MSQLEELKNLLEKCQQEKAELEKECSRLKRHHNALIEIFKAMEEENDKP